ncbi:MAG: DUF444 family protein [Firmicutes bacterium]|nr:DUF444 family protein [Alicyclobacillaceae bacterium]MCL6496459.1 DUF444 family protein [Bacillota bacterium]
MRPGWFSIGTGRYGLSPVWLDERRHQARIKEALRRNLAEMVAHEAILVSHGAKLIQVPLTGLREDRVRYDPQHGEAVGILASGQGEGEAAAGRATARGGGKQGGDAPGVEWEEAVFTVDEAAEVVFSDLALPDLDLRRTAPGAGETWEVQDLGPVGLQTQWARKPTLLASLRRGGPPVRRQDVRYRQFAAEPAPEGGAVVLAMMDTSGSMGQFEKFVAKSFFFWTVEFLRRNYPAVDIVFLAHDVRAREVDEEGFFRRGTSGGTVSSSVYRLALEVLAERYPPDRFNAYAFHFTDGGNLTSDNPLALELGQALAAATRLFGYGEIHDTERAPSPLFQGFERANVRTVLLRSSQDVFFALQRFFGKEGAAYGS